jgi:hypothetical protein
MCRAAYGPGKVRSPWTPPEARGQEFGKGKSPILHMSHKYGAIGLAGFSATQLQHPLINHVMVKDLQRLYFKRGVCGDTEGFSGVRGSFTAPWEATIVLLAYE